MALERRLERIRLMRVELLHAARAQGIRHRWVQSLGQGRERGGLASVAGGGHQLLAASRLDHGLPRHCCPRDGHPLP
jgi:hypothetical protein